MLGPRGKSDRIRVAAAIALTCASHTWAPRTQDRVESVVERVHAVDRAFRFGIDQSPEVPTLRRRALSGVRGIDNAELAAVLLRASTKLESELAILQGLRRSPLIDGGQDALVGSVSQWSKQRTLRVSVSRRPVVNTARDAGDNSMQTIVKGLTKEVRQWTRERELKKTSFGENWRLTTSGSR